MITIIAEKPSVARDIANVVGALQSKDGYLEGNGYFVTYAFGHLVGLAEPTAYGYSEKWLKDELPLMPTAFSLTANKEAKKQLSTIKTLFKASESIIVGTDAGREGELIFRWIYEYLKETKPFKRLWISDMTDKSIKNGMNNLLLGSEKDNLYFSAKARAESDWLIGLNATRLLTLNNDNLLSIGRVQTPTLRLITDRYLENKSFVVTDYWKPFIAVENSSPEQKIILTSEQEFSNENAIKKYVNELKLYTSCELKREDTKEKEIAPKLYSLTSLQKVANAKLNFTADQTLKTLQSLYETHKLVTYPRTDSEFLTDNQIDEVLERLDSHKVYFRETNYNNHNVHNNFAFNNAKVTDHHAVIPTHIVPTSSIIQRLTDNEKKLYHLVIVRFYQRFSSDCEKDKIIISTELNSNIFKTTQINETYKGWKIYNQDKEQEAQFPIVVQNGQSKRILDYSYSKHQTKPKPIHNEATLLTAMETAGKEIDNEELKEQMKGKGLGTPATRSGIIEILLKRKFIERSGKQLIPTTTAIDLINKIRNHKISVPEWTAEQEFALHKIETGEYSYNSFINRIKKTTELILSELDTIKVETKQNNLETFGTCPKCKIGTIKEGKKAFGCSDWKNGCDFVIWKTIAQKNISKSAVKLLLDKNKTNLIKGFVSSKGKPFEAYLILDSHFKTAFEFTKPKG